MPHDHMIFSVEECENATLIPEKNTAIIATSQGPIKLLMLTLFSLLLRSNQKYLEHIIVCINGPDTRCGDPSLQDKKQKFLEELRNMKWEDRDMPLTVIRAWSRIGHSQALEMAIPWVHTEYYTIMHDDIVVLENDWCEEANEIFKDPKVAIVQNGVAYFGTCAEITMNGNMNWIETAHMNSTFVMCKKSIIAELGCRWYGYYIKKDYSMKDINYEEYKNKNIQYKSNIEFPKENGKYNGVSMDIGSWVMYKIKNNNYKIETFSNKKIEHFWSASWSVDKNYVENTEIQYKNVFESIEKEINNHPQFAELYKKYNNS
jgi:hypothetical protein